MRIFDWSSDVCSSDLGDPGVQRKAVDRFEQLDLHVGDRPDEGGDDDEGERQVLALQPRLAGDDVNAEEGDQHAEGAPPAELVLEENGGEQRREGHLKLDGDRRGGGADALQPVEHEGEVQQAEGYGDGEDGTPLAGRPLGEWQQQQRDQGEARSHEQDGRRSEEHTSELQSLMRISYAVFCLKKKKEYAHHNSRHNNETKARRNG